MSVTIEDPKFEETVKELAAATGEPEAVSVQIAVKERLDRVTHRKGKELLESIRDIQQRLEALPELDPRPIDEIIGYNEHGTFD
jgi:antitoxin VapB